MYVLAYGLGFRVYASRILRLIRLIGFSARSFEESPAARGGRSQKKRLLHRMIVSGLLVMLTYKEPTGWKGGCKGGHVPS